MAAIETVSVGQGGDVPIPSTLREISGISAGALVTLEARDGAIVIRPLEKPGDIYSVEQKAEFLLSNSVDFDDYVAACDEVRKLGLDPDKISHSRPVGN